MSRLAMALVAAAVTSGCVAWSEPAMTQRRLPLARPVVELRTDVLPGQASILGDGTFRFVVDAAHLCRRTELVKEEVAVVERKQLTGIGVGAVIGGVAAILVGTVYAATSDQQGGSGAVLVFGGAALAGVPLYQRYARPPSRRERVAETRDVPTSTLDTACPDASVGRVLGELILTTPWGANVKAVPGTDGAAVFALDWAATGIDLRAANPGNRLMVAWRVRSGRTGLAVDWTPTIADRDQAVALIERAGASRPTEPPELVLVAAGADGGALVAGEDTTMRVTVENRGGGVARGLVATVRSSHAAVDGVTVDFGDLGPRETKTRTFKVSLREDERETQVTVVIKFALAAHTPPADHGLQVAITPRLCPPEKLTRVQYKARRDKLQAMVKDGILTEADLARYDAVLVGCLK